MLTQCHGVFECQNNGFLLKKLAFATDGEKTHLAHKVISSDPALVMVAHRQQSFHGASCSLWQEMTETMQRPEPQFPPGSPDLVEHRRRREHLTA